MIYPDVNNFPTGNWKLKSLDEKEKIKKNRTKRTAPILKHE